jgi:arylsulfatase A-like enzyme
VIDDVVSALDVAPTVFSFAGVPAPGEWTGVDLRPAIEGGEVPRTEVIGKMHAVRIVDPATHRAGPKTEAYFLRDDRWHYVWSPATDTELLFDVVDDPMETRNRAGDLADAAREMRSRIEAWRDEARPAPRGDAERRLLPKTG